MVIESQHRATQMNRNEHLINLLWHSFYAACTRIAHSLTHTHTHSFTPFLWKRIPNENVANGKKIAKSLWVPDIGSAHQ